MHSGPTRYYFYYGGNRHYYGTRTWGHCNGHCDQDVYIDEAEFVVDYADSARTPSESEAKQALLRLWPSLDPAMVSVRSGYSSTSRHFSVLLPDGTSAYSFERAVKADVEGSCIGSSPTFTFSNAGCILCRPAVGMDEYPFNCNPPTINVAIRQISTQAEAGGAALALPSMVCMVLAAAAVLLR